MIKYTPINTVLNYIPDSIRRDLDALKVMFYANTAYRRFNLPFQKKLEYAVLDVVNHKVVLPDDLLKIAEIRYNPYNPDTDTLTVLKDFGDYRLIVSQEIFFGSTFYTESRPLRYLGQNRTSLIDESMYCNNCDIGFSVNAELTCLTIDLPDGTIIMGYWTDVTNGENLLVPDHSDLLLGLAHFVQAQYWMEAMSTHTDNAINLYREHSRLAEIHLNQFRAKRLFASANIRKHNEFVFGRNVPNYDYHRNTYNKK